MGLRVRRQITRDLRKEVSKKLDLRRVPKRDLLRIGEAMIVLMLERIQKGISPISGKRFPAYKNPGNYPGDRKPKRPVNLDLTGDFLDDLDTRAVTGRRPRIYIGFRTKRSERKEIGHRRGANGQPKRPIIPQRRETFSRGILVRFNRIFRKAVTQALSRR